MNLISTRTMSTTASTTSDDQSSVADTLTNLTLPKSDSTITVRVIKSFEFRTFKNLVLHHLNLEKTTVKQLKETIRSCKIALSADKC